MVGLQGQYDLAYTRMYLQSQRMNKANDTPAEIIDKLVYPI